MKKRLLALLMVLVLSLGLISGCSDSKTKDQEEKIEDNIEKEDSEAGDKDLDEEVEITFWHAMSGSNEEALETLTDKFMEENPNIKVKLEFQGKYRELFEKLMASAKADSLPNLTQIYSNRLSWYVSKDLVQDLNHFIEDEEVGLSKEEIEDYPEMFLKDGEWDGKQFAMPLNKSQMVLYYNKTMFEEEGIEVPTTWEEWEAAAEALTKDTDGDGEPDIYGMVFANNISTDIAPWLKQAGGMTMSEETNELFFDTPETKEAVEFINGMIQNKVARLAGEDKYANVPVSQGRAAMCVASTSAISHIKEDTPDDIEIFAAPLPTYKHDDQLYYGTNIASFDVGEDSEKLASWLYIKFLTQPENTAYFAQNTGYLPVRYSAREVESYKKFLEESPINAVGLESFDKGFQGTRNIGGINALDVLGEELDLVFAGEKSVEEALKDAQERGTRALEEAGKN